MRRRRKADSGTRVGYMMGRWEREKGAQKITLSNCHKTRAVPMVTELRWVKHGSGLCVSPAEVTEQRHPCHVVDYSGES